MKTKTLAIIAIFLWTASAAFCGFKYVNEITATVVDGREEVLLEPAERDLVLTEMRGFLAVIQEIISAVNEGDMNEVKKLSSSVGLALANTTPPETVRKLPNPFKRMAFSTHESFDEVSLAAEMGGEAVMETLEETISVCVSCHEVYRISETK